MKKEITSILMFGAFICILTGCANTNTASTSEPPVTESEPVQEELQPEETTSGSVEEVTSGLLRVELDFQRSGTKASNQYAVWVENESGELIQTLYVSDFTASGGYAQREESIPTWVSKANPAELEQAEIDAISSATPQSGIQSYQWDGTDTDGNLVPDGNYHVYVEGTLYWSSAVLFSGSFYLGGSSENIEMTAVYTEPDKEENRDMLAKVTAEYIKGASSTDTAEEAMMNQPTNDLGALSPEDALEYMKKTPDLIIVDVAATRWYDEEHFENAMNIPIEELDSEEEDALYMEIPAGHPVLLHCRRGMIVPGAYERVKELRSDIPEISYIDGTPPFAEYNEWLANQ